jgi:pimeloyl-ACP methyl ester carboxylesterase
MFDGWAKELKSERPELTDAALTSFRESMYGGDFVFAVTRDFVRSCSTPLMVLAGDDLYHPAPISREIAELAPNLEFVPVWKTPEAAAEAVNRIKTFLKRYE